MPSPWDTRPQTDVDILACLRELPPLRKPHWSWPFDQGLLGRPEYLRECIRIAGAGAIQGEVDAYSHPSAWQRSLRTIIDAGRQTRDPVDLVLTISPFGGTTWGLGANDPRLAANTPRGLAEVARIRRNLESTASLIAAEATAAGCSANVAAVWIDQETFKLGPDDEWNQALAWCNESILQGVKATFPRAHALQHGRGKSSYYGPRELRSGSHVEECYNVADFEGTARQIKEGVERAAADGITAYYPVLAFGGRYFARFHAAAGWWPAPTPLNHIWRLGSYLNDPYYGAKHWGPWVDGYIHRILLWPELFPATTSTGAGQRPVPHYGLEFITYCCGASRIQPAWIPEVPDA